MATPHLKWILSALAFAICSALPSFALSEETTTQWRDLSYETENTAPIEKSLAEVNTLLSGNLDDLLSQIDRLQGTTSSCIAEAVRLAGAENRREKLSCYVQHEGAKMELFKSTQRVLDDLGRELLGVAEAYNRDRVLIDQKLAASDEAKRIFKERMDALQQSTVTLISTLEGTDLTREEEQKIRAAIRAFEAAKIDDDKLTSRAQALQTDRARAVYYSDAIEDWAYESLNGAMDLDNDIARSELVVETVIREARNGAQDTAYATMPGSIHKLGEAIAKLNDMVSRPVEITPATEEAPLLALPEKNHAELIAKLKALVEDDSAEETSSQ